MVDPEQTRVLKLMAQVVNVVPVTLRPDILGMKRRKAPILSFREDNVRGRAS